MRAWLLAWIGGALRHPWFVIAAAAISSGVGLYLLFRTWEDLREGRQKGRSDRLSEYRELYEQGLMSEAEYARICDQLGIKSAASRPRAGEPRMERTPPGPPTRSAGDTPGGAQSDQD